MLFNNYNRTFAGWSTHDMSAYEFMDKSAWRICGLMREYYNSWAESFFDDKEFISRFKSKDDKQHYSACFELIVYTLFKNSGFKIVKHPNIGQKSKVDFGLNLDTTNPMFLECTLSSDSFLSHKEKNQREKVKQVVDAIEYYPYYINLSFISTSDISISHKALRKFLEEVRLKSENIPNEALFHLRYSFESNGWNIEISLLRKPLPIDKMSLGYVHDGAREINTSKPLLTALLDKKPNKYGLNNVPYVICLSSNDTFVKGDCFSEALFGQPSSMKIELDYVYKDGFYYANKKPVNTRVSAVIFFKNFNSFTLEHSNISVWHNPFAKTPIPNNSLLFEEYYFERIENTLKQKKYDMNLDIFKILNIDKEKYVEWKDKSIG